MFGTCEVASVARVLLLLPGPMTLEDPYRSELVLRCSWCTGPSAAGCPRCNRRLCAVHGIPPEWLCAACAEHELMRVTRAGDGLMSAALGFTVAAAVAAQVFGAFHPALWIAIIALALVGVGFGIAGLVSRPLARRQVARERALSTVEREGIERRALEGVPRSLPPPPGPVQKQGS